MRAYRPHPFLVCLYGGRGWSLQLIALLAKNGFAAQLDFVAFKRQHLHQDLIALLQLVAYSFDPVLRDFADVQQAVGAGEDPDKRANPPQPYHLAKIGFAHFGNRANIGDALDGQLGGLAVGGEDLDRTVLLDIDLHAGFFYDAADHLAARPDQIADLVGRNLKRVDARRVLRHFTARRGEGRHHFVQDEQPGHFGLCHRLFHDLGGDVGDLDVHLQAGNAFARSRHFKVHVAVVIFGARDIGEDGVVFAFQHQAHGDTGHWIGDRYTRIHERQYPAAYAGHGTGSIRFQNVTDHANGIGELLVVGHHCRDGPFSQCAMSDFAASGSTHESNLAYAEGREVVMQHEALGGLGEIEHLDALFVVLGAERYGYQGLRFASGK